MPRSRKPRSSKPAPPASEHVIVYPVDGAFLPGVAHATTEVSADEAAAMVATGAFSLEPQWITIPGTHEPECNDQCDPATGTHYLIGEPTDAEAPSNAEDEADAGSEPPGEQPASPDEAAPQPDGPADEAGPSDSQE